MTIERLDELRGLVAEAEQEVHRPCKWWQRHLWGTWIDDPHYETHVINNKIVLTTGSSLWQYRRCTKCGRVQQTKIGPLSHEQVASYYKNQR